MTILSVLDNHLDELPDQIAIQYFDADLTVKSALSYRDLADRARLIASEINEHISPGDRVVLAYPAGTEFLCAFLACLYCGAIAVPANTPRANREDLRFSSIIRDAEPSIILTEADCFFDIEAQCATFTLPYFGSIICSDTMRGKAPNHWQPFGAEPDDIALLQYTSGSTGAPKGVVIPHKSLIANIRMVKQGLQVGTDDVFVTWTPNFHDMGLIVSQLLPVYVGCPVYLMSPRDFIRNPVNWLRLISEFGGTFSAAPNFAYDLCARLANEGKVPEMFLGGWRKAGNGSEPIHESTLTGFIEAFAPYGFRPESLSPGYGLAEVCVYVCSSPPDQRYKNIIVDHKALEQGQIAPAKTPETAKTLIGCGHPVLDGEIAIVDPESRMCLDRDKIGEIWLTGPHVASGYWQNLSATGEAFGQLIEGDDTGNLYYRTGDLGFVRDNETFITGRIKDLIIIRGRNFYPQDIERVVKELEPEFFPKDSVAFSIEAENEERLVILQTVPQNYDIKSAEIFSKRLQHALTAQYEIQASRIVLVKDRSLPKTTSGKIARRACRQGYLDKKLSILWEYSAPNISHSSIDPPDDMKSERLEEWLTNLVTKQFALQQFDPDKNLFDLGLDSLGLVQLICTIEDAIDLSIDEVNFIENATISGIAKLIAEPVTDPELGEDILVEHKTANEPHQKPMLKFLSRIAARIRWYGPHLGTLPLMPYRIGSHILHWLVSRKTIQKLFYSSQIALLMEVAHNVPHEEPFSRLKIQFLQTISWQMWREICLHRPEDFKKHVSHIGLENVQQGLEEGKGLILACPHSTLKSLIRHIPIFADIELLIIGNFGNEQLLNYGLDDIGHHQQSRAGEYNPRVRFAQLRRAREILDRGGLVLIFPDAYIGEGGIEVNFHGRTRPIRPGMVELARQTGAALVPTFYRMASDGRVEFEFEDNMMAGAKSDKPVSEILEKYADILSEKWKSDLGQYETYALLKYLELPLVDEAGSAKNLSEASSAINQDGKMKAQNPADVDQLLKEHDSRLSKRPYQLP